MSYDLSQISSEVICRAPRIVLLGVAKIGKTTFAANADNAILIPVKGEEGADDMSCAKTPVCNSFDDVVGWLATLHGSEHQYSTVVIDSSSTLQPLIFDHVVARSEKGNSIETVNGGFQSGYQEALIEWRIITDWLDALRRDKNMASIIIGHVVTDRFSDPRTETYDRWSWDIHKRAAAALTKWADCVLFCDYKLHIEKEDVGFGKKEKRAKEITPNERYLYTQTRMSHPGGGRGVYGRLPYELPLDWNAFANAVSAAMEKK